MGALGVDRVSPADSKLVRGYNRLAAIYRPLEFCLFGNALQRSRVALLGRLPTVERALVLGDGDGRLLEQLCLQQPTCRFTSLDLSTEMLKRQRRRVERASASGRVEFVVEDASVYRPSEGHFDMVVAAYFLDCFSERDLEMLLPRLLDGVRSQGYLYFVDFVHPSRGLRRRQSKLYQRLMHWLFRWQTGLTNRDLVDMDSVLGRQNLVLVESASGGHPMMTTRIYQKTGFTD